VFGRALTCRLLLASGFGHRAAPLSHMMSTMAKYVLEYQIVGILMLSNPSVVLSA
jgi:hypothetical protein